MNYFSAERPVSYLQLLPQDICEHVIKPMLASPNQERNILYELFFKILDLKKSLENPADKLIVLDLDQLLYLYKEQGKNFRKLILKEFPASDVKKCVLLCPKIEVLKLIATVFSKEILDVCVKNSAVKSIQAIYLLNCTLTEGSLSSLLETWQIKLKKVFLLDCSLKKNEVHDFLNNPKFYNLNKLKILGFFTPTELYFPFSNLTELSLVHCSIGPENIKILVKEGLTKVVYLNLSCNYLGSIGLKKISKANLAALKALNVSNNLIRSNVFKKINKNSSFSLLEFLDLSANELGLNSDYRSLRKCGIEEFVNCSVFKNLKNLIMDQNDIAQDEVIHFQNLSINSLESLSLKGNSLDEGATFATLKEKVLPQLRIIV